MPDDATKTLQEVVAEAAKALHWTEEEARNFISAIVTESPEALPEAITEALAIANEIENRAAVVGLMKQMGRAIQCRVENGELTIRLHPGCSVREDAAGIHVTSPAGA